MAEKSLCLALVAMVICFCHGNPEGNQVMMFRDLPENGEFPLPVHFIIRSTFEGVVEFIESPNFNIQVNVSAENIDELSKVHYNYTDYRGSVLLQLFEKDPEAVKSPVKFILLVIGGATVLMFLLTILFMLWWNAYKRPLIKATKLFHPDSSQAPLLDGKQVGDADGGANGKLKKRKKRKPSKTMTNEEYVSSEEDTLDRHGNPQVTPTRKPAYGSPRKDMQVPESDLVATVKRSSPAPLGSTEGMTTLDPSDTARSMPPDGSTGDKPVVSYIKMQADDPKYKRKGGQYIPLSQSEGSGSDIEKQATLKIRRDDSTDSQTMPDVIRRNRPIDQSARKNGSQYVRLTNTEVDSSDGEYTNMGKLTGAQIAQILSDHNKGSPKFSHNTDRLPTTFAPQTMPRERAGDLDQLELDSVGSSRSGGSSKSSGFKTQTGSYSDSLRSDSKSGGPPFSDSDSAKSTSSSSTYPRTTKEGSTFSSKYFLQQHGNRQNGHSPSDHSDGSSPRLVDEAYGTMGSNGSNTIRSSSASTGSGSSGSVVTIVAADDPNNSFGRRKGMRPPTGNIPTKDSTQPPGTTRGGGGGSSYGTAGQKYLHMSVVMSVCLVSLLTGVYCRWGAKTQVHIKVYAPSGFIQNGSEVYFNRDNNKIVYHTSVSTKAMRYKLDVRQFQVENAYLKNPQDNKCAMTSCAQGCDPNTGRCICHHGYKISDGYHCDDIDECTEAPNMCDQNAQCFNTPGSFQCMCQEGFYGDGVICNACNDPCQNGTYEVMPCSDTHPKLCKECSVSCMEEYFISAPCNSKNNRECTTCTPRCSQGKFEYTACHGNQDRKCRDVVDLINPKVSKNIIYENRQKAKQVFSYLLHQTTTTGPLTHMLELKRGSDFSVHISLKESNLAPLFEAVDHADSNDNSGFYGDLAITQQYCPYPVPEKYQLSLVLHQGVTTRAQYYNCDQDHRRGTSQTQKCEKETGYYLDPREPCETYSHFGRLPALNPEGWSVICAQPGRLSDLFGVSTELNDLSTMFVDKTVRCAEQRTNCDACLVMCSRTMQNRQGSHRCNITGEDADNGESPRLQHCFGCCGKQECSKLCEVYHNSDCEPIRCVTGNLAEFVLRPVFSHRGTVFGCHIGPKKGYVIYDINYSVLYKGKPVSSKVLKAQKIFDGHHPEKAIDQHNFLRVYYGSEVKGEVDFIEGDSAMRSFSAGYYIEQGLGVGDTDVTTRTLSVRPRKPFAVSTEFWKRQDCETDALADLLLATSNNPDSDPYKPDPQVTVQFVESGRYRIFNRTVVPFIYFEVPNNMSVLKPLFDDTTVKDDSTLKAEIIRREDKWTLKIHGELEKCPGFFSVRVSDPNYPEQGLFEYDVGVECPKSFRLDFDIPTRGKDNYDKRFRVEIEDSFRTINMIVFRPAPNISQEAFAFFWSNETRHKPVNYAEKVEKEMTVFTPIVAVLCVVVSFLAILLCVGFVTDSATKPPKPMDNKVHSQHLLFVVCYVTFRAAYSLAVTFTVLLLLIRFANRESVSTIMEFHRFAETADNLQKMEVERIQAFVSEELQRQNQLANSTKVGCEQKLQSLQNVLEQTKQQLKVDNMEERLVSQVALQYTKLMILNLTNDIIKFKQEFSSYAQKAVDRLTRSIVQTSSALLSNKWLAGAKVIYDVVQNKRESQGQSTKPFLDWVGIQQEVESLSVDLSLENFPMPNLTEFLALQIPQTNHRQSNIPSISDINLPRNQWYFQYENKPSASPGDESMPKQRSAKVDTSGIMSWKSLLITLIFVDLIWFVHRMAKTYSTAKMILYGVPYYIDCKKSAGDARSPQRKPRRVAHSISGRCLNFIKDLNLRIMKTEFVPKLVATATSCCAIYLILRASDHLVTVKSLASVGYFDTLVAPIETSYRLARTRMKTNAYRINKFEYPFYEELVNVRTKRYQLMLEMYRDLQRSNNILHDSEYCAWKKMLDPTQSCNCTSAKTVKLHFDGCELPPVTPHAYEKVFLRSRRDFSSQKAKLSTAMMPYINSARQVIIDTCHLALVFVSLLVLVDILGAVTWIYLKRFNLLRLKPLFEIEQCPERTQS